MAHSSPLGVVIVSYNTCDFLRGCLSALQRLTDEGPFLIMVVDNASTDGSVSMVKSQFPEVRLVALPENVGFAQANNFGAQELDCGEILFLNPDTVVRKGAIQKLRASLAAHPRTAVVGAQLVSESGVSLPSSFAFPSLWREFWNFLPELKRVFRVRALASAMSRLLPGLWRGSYRTGDEERQVNSVAGACMLVRADAFRQVGGFCKEFFLYHEEMELCYRLRKQGWEIRLEPRAQVIHYEGQASGTRPFRMAPMPVLRYSILGRNYFWLVHHPGLQYAVWRFMAQALLGLRAGLCSGAAVLSVGEARRRMRKRAADIRGVMSELKGKKRGLDS
jgi:GT2 family glycosyltransferase